MDQVSREEGGLIATLGNGIQNLSSLLENGTPNLPRDRRRYSALTDITVPDQTFLDKCSY